MKFALSLLLLAILACSLPATSLTSIPSAAREIVLSPMAETAPTAENVEIITPATDTYLRSCPSLGCRQVGWARAGNALTAICTGDWCRVVDSGRFFCLPAATRKGGCK